MLNLEGNRIGDAWYFAEGDTVLVFFLVMTLERKSGWEIGHAISQDLVHWDYLGLALMVHIIGARVFD